MKAKKLRLFLVLCNSIYSLVTDSGIELLFKSFGEEIYMAEVKDHLEIKFRLSDGSDIGPRSFPDATTVASLKETVVSQWPKEKENGPKTVKDVKLISAGRILENNKTVGDCRSPVSNLSDAVTTMHVLIQPQVTEKAEKKKKKKKPKGDLKQNKWVCLCFGRRI